MKHKIVKITEAQLKKVIEGLINEQSSAGGANTGQTNPNTIYSSGPNNMGGQRPQDFDNFINQSKLNCVRGGDLEFGMHAKYGLFVRFYVSEDKKQFVKIYSNSRAHVSMTDESGTTINKMVMARCYVTPPLKNGTINLYDGGKLMYTLDPKKPIKDKVKDTTKEPNQNIIAWQKKLVADGFDLGTNNPLGYGPGIDGIWGKKTQAAYEAYLARERRINEPLSTEPKVPVSKVEPIPMDKLKYNLNQKIGKPQINIQPSVTTPKPKRGLFRKKR